MGDDRVALLLVLLAGPATLLLTGLVRAYALRQRLLDQPGRRRLHVAATPRGGGLAMVLPVALLWVWLAVPDSALPLQGVWLLALLLVAGIGWIDDHGGAPVRLRLALHGLAALLAASVLLAPTVASAPWPGPLLWLLPCALALVASINLHNFMDGMNGLLTLQALFVAAAVSLLAYLGGDLPLSLAALALALACFGFLPWNYPRARIFLGDVGSGSLGLLLGALLWLAWRREHLQLAAGLILVSAFLVDGLLTLAHRVGQGRRWYSAHREHLYQWLHRVGFSHARVSLGYLGWNLLLVAPVLALVHHHPALAWPAAALVLVLAAGIWGGAKRACLRRPRRRRKTL